MIDLTRYSFSWRALFRRFRATSGVSPRWMNLLRAVSTEGFGRLRYYREICGRLATDRQFLPYFAQETAELPRFYVDLVCKDLGPLWNWLPEGGLYHDPYAYLESERSHSPSLHEKVLASAPSANGASGATIRTHSVCSPSASSGESAGRSNELAGFGTANGQLGVRNDTKGDRHVGI